MSGLGRMGGNMTRRLIAKDHSVVAFDVNPEAVSALVAEGAEPATSISELTQKLESPRIVWVMVPSGEITSATIRDVAGSLDKGDVIIDGGNSRYTDTIERAARLAEAGIHLVDAGTSGGIWGLTEGYCLMVGGEPEAVTAA